MSQQNDGAREDASNPPFPTVREISAGAPFGWIARGFADLLHCPIPSLFYGFCFAAMAVFSSSETLGSAIGMNIRSPSFNGGMNSRPMPRATRSAPAKRSPAMVSVAARCVRAASSTGR